MRKIFPYILIFTLLISFFPFSNQANAQEIKKDGWYFKYKNSAYNPDSNPLGLKEFIEDGPHSSSEICNSISTQKGGGPCYNIIGGVEQEGISSEKISEYVASYQADLAKKQAEKEEFDFNCGVFGEESSIMGCVVQVTYHLIFEPIQSLAKLSAHFLDFFIKYSIDSKTYSEMPIVGEAWKLIRDISNIFFIFILMYIALFINFSLFATKVVIDASNILAHIFYNNVKSVDANGNEIPPESTTPKSITVGIVQKVDFQDGLDQGVYNENKGKFFFILLFHIIIAGYMIYVFASTALFFVARTIGLWFSMIFSPFAFLSYAVPGGGGFLKDLGHAKWWDNLFKSAFLAPVFLFFIFLVLKFLEIKIPYNITDENGMEAFTSIAIKLVLVFILLMKAKDIAKEFSGQIGSVITKAGATVAGLAGGAVLGGAALAGRGTLGRFAAKSLEGAEGEALRERAKTSKLAAFQLRSLEGLSKSSLDLRKTGAGKILQEQTGLKFGTPGGRIPLVGVDLTTEGGYRGAVERKTKRQEELSEMIKMRGPEADVQNARAKAWDKQYEDERKKAQSSSFNAGLAFDDANFRKMYEAGKKAGDLKLKDAGGNVIYSNTAATTSKVMNAAETNAQRMRDQADAKEYSPGYIAFRNDAKEKTRNQAGANAAKIAAGGALTPAEIAAEKFDENNIKNAFLGKDPNYIKEKADAQLAAAKAGKAFDENIWREEEYFRRKVGSADMQVISDLRKKAGEEEKKEKPASPKEKALAEKTFARATDKLAEIDKHFRNIAATLTPTKEAAKVEPADVKIAVQKEAERLNKLETTLFVKEQKLRADPDNEIAAREFTTAKAEVKTSEETLNSYRTLFNDKEKAQKDLDEATKIKNS